jgi:hypothetical protein
MPHGRSDVLRAGLIAQAELGDWEQLGTSFAARRGLPVPAWATSPGSVGDAPFSITCCNVTAWRRYRCYKPTRFFAAPQARAKNGEPFKFANEREHNSDRAVDLPNPLAPPPHDELIPHGR